MRELRSLLGIPLERLREFATKQSSSYRVWTEHDPIKNKSRTYEEPAEPLKAIQRSIVSNVLARHELDDAVHGAVKTRSPQTNAHPHLGQPMVASVDVVRFFETVSYRKVFRMFRNEFGYGRDVSWLLTKLVTYEGRLPTGAPSSPAVANALLTASVDRRLQAMARRLNANYTRYVDDMTFSGDNAVDLINESALALSGLRLRISRAKRKKLKVMSQSVRQTVTGLNVNSRSGPSVGRQRLASVRSEIHRLPWLEGVERERAIRRIEGKITHVEQHNPGPARRLRRQLEATNNPAQNSTSSSQRGSDPISGSVSGNDGSNVPTNLFVESSLV